MLTVMKSVMNVGYKSPVFNRDQYCDISPVQYYRNPVVIGGRWLEVVHYHAQAVYLSTSTMPAPNNYRCFVILCEFAFDSVNSGNTRISKLCNLVSRHCWMLRHQRLHLFPLKSELVSRL
jgi:hypothetical protein